MKKLVLLAAVIGLAAAPPVSARKLVKLNGNLTPAATLESGKTYLIYDASKIKGPEIGVGDDAEKAAFRYVSEDGDEEGEIWGDYEQNPSSEAMVDYSTYAWVVNGSEDEGFSFKNVDTGLYIPKNNNYTSWNDQNDMMVTDEEVKFHLLQTEPNGNYHVVGFDDNNIWDGRWWDDDCRMTSYWKVSDYAGNHWYQFFEVTDDMIVEEYNISVRIYTQDNAYLGGWVLSVTSEEYSVGSKISFPDVLDGELIVSDGAQAKFTVKEGVRPFKLVSARHRTLWAECYGYMYTGEGENASEAGTWFLEQKDGEYSKFFSVNDLKYLGEIFDSEDPVECVSDASQANLFRIVRNESGAECIYNSHNDIAFNIRNENVAGWNRIDSGSYWFMVYDSDTYEANKEYFFGDTEGELERNYISPFGKSLAEARSIATNAARIDKSDDEWTAAITRLNNAIMAAETARFGVKDTDISAIMQELEEAKSGFPIRDIAIVVYESLVGTKYDDGAFIGVPGYADPWDNHVLDLYNAISDGYQNEMLEAMVAAESASIESTYDTYDNAVYTLRSTDLDALGYLCNRDGAMVNTKAPESIDFVSNNPDFHFTFVKYRGHSYLYNIGAGMFMNAFGMQTDNEDETIRNRADYSWRFSDMPTEIVELLPFNESTPHSFTIKAGLAPSNSEGFLGEPEGGLSMTAGGSRPNIVSMGISNREDGNGLQAEYVRKLSFDEWDEVFKKAQRALQDVQDQVAAIPETISLDGHIVNHYTYEAAQAIRSVDANDHQHYLMEIGERQQPVVGTAYTLVDENQNAWHVTSDGEVVSGPISEMNDENKAFYQWIVAVNTSAVSDPEDLETENVQTFQLSSDVPTYSFIHIHDGKRIALAIDGVTEHNLGTQYLGKVNIAGHNYVMASTLGDATTGDGSTSIVEINDETPSTEIYYDLRGCRVVAPVKGGIYVTANGKKVIF